jgi:hypothetical protein
MNMKKLFASALLSLASALYAQSTAAPVAPEDPLKPLSFLEGTWEAKTEGGTASAQAAGTYTFRMELKRHILGRHSNNDAGCTGPTDFNCDHSDMLYIYPDEVTKGLRAIYFDNEGHVINYNVTLPDSTTAVFLSDATQPGPQFQLVYELKSGVMSGKFFIRMGGQMEWKPYIAWSGGKR